MSGFGHSSTIGTGLGTVEQPVSQHTSTVAIGNDSIILDLQIMHHLGIVVGCLAHIGQLLLDGLSRVHLTQSFRLPVLGHERLVLRFPSASTELVARPNEGDSSHGVCCESQVHHGVAGVVVVTDARSTVVVEGCWFQSRPFFE